MTPVYIKNADSFSFYKKEKKKVFGEREGRKKKTKRESAYKTQKKNMMINDIS